MCHSPENASMRLADRILRFRVYTGSLRGAWCLIGLFLGSNLAAQQVESLSLAEAERLALAGDPGRAALEARAYALQEESIVAAQLPDPRLRVGLVNYPLEAGGFSTEGMTQVQIGYHQSFPPGETRELSALQVQALALELTETANDRDRAVLTAVRSDWLRAYYWEHAQEIVMESRPLFADLVTITRSLYAVGTRDQQDVLRAQLELSRLDDRLLEIGRHLAETRASLSEWLPDAASRPLADSLPGWDELPSLDELRYRLAQHPALMAADARIEARGFGIEVAEEQSKAGWSVDVGYGYREGYLPNGSPRSDLVTVNFAVDLPFFKRNRQDRSLAAAFSERRAAESSKEELMRRLMSQLEAAFSRWQELTRRIELYEAQIVIQTRDHSQAALLAYQSDAGDFSDVMRGYIDELNVRLDHLQLQIDRAETYARLANLGGLL